MTCSKSNDLEIIRPKLKVPCFSSVTIFSCKLSRGKDGWGERGWGGRRQIGVWGERESVDLETGWVRGV